MASESSSTSSTSTYVAVQRSQRQGALRSRASSRRMFSAVSFVQRLALREVSGQSLHLSVHQHFGFRMHSEWSGTFGNRSIERLFRTYETVRTFCAFINTLTLEGVCTCITHRDEFFDGFWLMNDKVTIRRAPLPPLPEWLDGPWASIRQERVWAIPAHTLRAVGLSPSNVWNNKSGKMFS
jgi:hypothetical protein